jgi:hypothetical protein
MKFVILIVVTLVGCEDMKVEAPPNGKCVEFDHPSMHGRQPVMCRMIWCQQGVWSTQLDFHDTGGVASLWCDAIDGGAK